MIGDSIIQYASLSHGTAADDTDSNILPDGHGFCFAAGLQEHVQRRLDIVNRGLSGYNTSNAMAILDDISPSKSPARVDYLLLLFGSNDSCLPGVSTNQHVPLEQFRQNMEAIIDHASRLSHEPKILLVTPPPINEVQLEEEDIKKGHPRLTREQSVTSDYAYEVREIAKKYEDRNVVLVDLWKAMLDVALKSTPDFPYWTGRSKHNILIGQRRYGDNEGLRKLLVDGVHLTGAGYKIFLDQVLPHVEPGWEGISTDRPNPPACVFPHWSIAPRIEVAPLQTTDPG